MRTTGQYHYGLDVGWYIKNSPQSVTGGKPLCHFRSSQLFNFLHVTFSALHVEYCWVDLFGHGHLTEWIGTMFWVLWYIKRSHKCKKNLHLLQIICCLASYIFRLWFGKKKRISLCFTNYYQNIPKYDMKIIIEIRSLFSLFNETTFWHIFIFHTMVGINIACLYVMILITVFVCVFFFFLLFFQLSVLEIFLI